jgi:hypothetical protein
MAVLVASSQNLLTLVLLGVFTLVGIVVGEYARIKSRGKLMRKLKYALWAATLATVWWIVALVSAVVGGKGIARPPLSGASSEASEAAARALLGQTTPDPYAFGGPEWRGDGCKGRPVNLGLYSGAGEIDV